MYYDITNAKKITISSEKKLIREQNVVEAED